MSQGTRVVFAFAGWPDEARAIRELVEHEQDEVVTLTLDLGQRQDLDSVRQVALAAGAVRAHVIDARETLVNDFFLPALRSCGASAGGVVLARDLCTAVVARSLVEIAEVEGAAFVAHGAAAHDDERHAVFDSLIEDLAPRRLGVLWPASFVDAAAPDDVALVAGEPSQTSVARELRMDGRTSATPAADLYRVTRDPSNAPDVPAHVTVEIERGVPTAVNGVGMPLTEILDSLDTIVGAHGVGRYDGVIRSYVSRRAWPVRHIGEAPAALALAAAQEALERHAWSAELYDLTEQTAAACRALIRRGQWFSPTRAAIAALVDSAHAAVTGRVQLDLFKGGCQVAGVEVGTGPHVALHP
jgi:argininosuccinate synthase